MSPKGTLMSEKIIIGLREEEWPTTPEAIACWIEEFNGIPPLEMTPEDEEAWHAQREYEFATWDTHSQRIEGLVE